LLLELQLYIAQALFSLADCPTIFFGQLNDCRVCAIYWIFVQWADIAKFGFLFMVNPA
jgi:hypothetical protein